MNMIYLDNAATTFPKPQVVYDAVMECMTKYGANPGRSGHKMALEAGRAIYECRESLAKLFKVKNPMNFVFTSNGTDSLNLAIKGLLKPGDHVITTSMEHNSVIRPIKALEQIGVENTVVDCNEEGLLDPKDIENAIRENTRLVVTTHASNVTGTIIDIEAIGAICGEKDVIYLVDGAQSAGVYDIDLSRMNIDMLALPGHKGLLGPQGTGVLYIRDGLSIKEMKQGGTGSRSEDLYQPQLVPDKYESGTANTCGIAGLNAGVKFVMDQGIDKIRKHEEELTQYFIDGLLKIDKVRVYGTRDSKKQAAVVSINIGDMDSSHATFLLDSQYNIATRSGLHCSPLAHKTIGSFEQGVVRFSIGYFTTIEELDAAIEAVSKISKEAF